MPARTVPALPVGGGGTSAAGFAEADADAGGGGAAWAEAEALAEPAGLRATPHTRTCGLSPPHAERESGAGQLGHTWPRVTFPEAIRSMPAHGRLSAHARHCSDALARRWVTCSAHGSGATSSCIESQRDARPQNASGVGVVSSEHAATRAKSPEHTAIKQERARGVTRRGQGTARPLIEPNKWAN